MTPAALAQSVVASMPDSDCLGGTSDDGTGNYVLGYMTGPGPVFPSYLFFTIKDGQAQRVGDQVLGSDEGATYLFSQPSGFSSFQVSGSSGGSVMTSYTHEGARARTEVAVHGFSPSAVSPTSAIGIDPSGGTALARSQGDSTGTWTTSYRRFDKTGAPETDWIEIDSSTVMTRVGAVGVALSGDALVLADRPDGWRALWVDRTGKKLTDWFGPVGAAGFPRLQFLMDGSLALRFQSSKYPFPMGPWQARLEDAKGEASPVPDWLKDRPGNSLFVIRNGAAYASWGVAGHCDSNLEVVAAGTGKSCGCLEVPNLGKTSSVGRDGSLIVARPEPSVNKCQYDLYPQFLK